MAGDEISPVRAEFWRMLDRLEQLAQHDTIYGETEYDRLRDACLEFIDHHPEVAQDAHDFGLPT